MSNSLSISPSVMINRIVDRTVMPAENQLAKVAELRLSLEYAARDEQAKAAERSPDGAAEAPVINSGTVVDRLI